MITTQNKHLKSVIALALLTVSTATELQPMEIFAWRQLLASGSLYQSS